MIGINGSTSGSTSVAGTATLGGATVRVASGSTVTPGVKYTILTTIKGGTVSGTFNSTPVIFGTLKGTLSYDATDVFLTFAFPTLTPLLPPNAPTMSSTRRTELTISSMAAARYRQPFRT
jgi:hypothetical protein